MDPIEKFRGIVAALNLGKNPPQKAVRAHKERALICTPYVGGYGTIYGWVVCVNGSPPKGSLLIKNLQANPVTAFYMMEYSVKKVSGVRQLEAIQQFYEAQLKGKSEAFSIQ